MKETGNKVMSVTSIHYFGNCKCIAEQYIYEAFMSAKVFHPIISPMT